MRVGEGVVGSISIGVSGVSVGGSGVVESISIGFPLLAAVKVGAGVSGITVSGDSGGAWNGDVGSVDAWGGLESGEAVGSEAVGSVCVGESTVEERWVSLSLGVDGGHKGEKSNLQEPDENDDKHFVFK